MTQIQINLSEQEDFLIEMFKLRYRMDTKADAIKSMIRQFEGEITINLKPNYKWKQHGTEQ